MGAILRGAARLRALLRAAGRGALCSAPRCFCVRAAREAGRGDAAVRAAADRLLAAAPPALRGAHRRDREAASLRARWARERNDDARSNGRRQHERTALVAVSAAQRRPRVRGLSDRRVLAERTRRVLSLPRRRAHGRGFARGLRRRRTTALAVWLAPRKRHLFMGWFCRRLARADARPRPDGPSGAPTAACTRRSSASRSRSRGRRAARRAPSRCAARSRCGCRRGDLARARRASAGRHRATARRCSRTRSR